ncbi:hypothetical protein PMI04_008665 [Sphingobium sp. AP49]|uniref:hypothetical protein n=1 Tax=Sphingobium sp. AP49 TaxID=1144307 RepID=UPI00026ED3CB|nr:hypothetical protein [Sphingobium sp. AP49]WHO40643.1 hypothetical protein PMI04_008665 [Sphingobium sp. AP49]
MSREQAYRAATEQALALRTQALTSLADARARIAPARLKADAEAKVTATALDGIAYVGAKVQQRPVATGAAATGLVLFLFRRPLTALFGRLYVRLRDRKTENSEIDDG